MPEETSIIITALKEKLHEIEKRLAVIDEDIDRFTDPFPRQENYDTILGYLRERQEYIERHLNGKYSSGKMQKLYDEKVGLEFKKTELINELFRKERTYRTKTGGGK
jgi:hypothetical protein